jgi:ABC-type transport system involved in multi-copper enzyme maturation permease subunit
MTAPTAIPFTRLLRVEWGKATDTRAARWLLGITGLAAVAIMLAPILAKHKIAQTTQHYVQFPAFVLSTLLPVVAILTLTSEWTQRTVLTTFTQEPRRSRVVAAKVAVSALLALAATVFGALLASGGVALVEGGGRHVVDNIGWGQVIGFPVFLLANMLLGTAFGALLHNSAAAIVLVFVLPTAFGFLGQAVEAVQHWLDPDTTFGWMVSGAWSGHGPEMAVSFTAWVLLPLVAGFARTVRREIK